MFLGTKRVMALAH